MSRNPEIELYEPTPFVYPKGYFRAQTLLAEKVLSLGLSPNIQSAILNYTVIYRHLVGHNPTRRGPDQKWLEFVHGLSKERDITDQVWQFYTEQPRSVYRTEPVPNDGQHFGSFIQKPAIDTFTDDQKIEIHFNNRRRGQQKSDFSRQFTHERTQDLTRLFESVKDHTKTDEAYHPRWVTLVSWMNNLPGVIAVLPPDFTRSTTIVHPPELNFRSNSLWGQFLTNNGGVNLKRYKHFQENLDQASAINHLASSFPVPVYSSRAPIEAFFDFYSIG